jgi:hypothetical protein
MKFNNNWRPLKMDMKSEVLNTIQEVKRRRRRRRWRRRSSYILIVNTTE